MPASVTIEDNEAEFEASEANEGATLALCDLLEEADRGRMTSIELASRLRELTEAAPEHIDARAHLGSVLLESEQLQEAAAEYERAFEIGSKALPTDFDGRIEWIRLDNRPFLRAAYGLALVRLKTGKRTEAIRLMEQLLRWNPNDNQGVRLSIGSEYLRAGHRTKASKVLRCQRSPERVRLFCVGGPEGSRRGCERHGKSYLTRRRRGEEGDGGGSLTGGAIPSA